ncbi:hypothetical protein GJ496_007305 [Pomphorhynchus laevis]|nr:hypothetical protein GJ496_007305 [Pomphorhynchus laevis]
MYDGKINVGGLGFKIFERQWPKTEMLRIEPESEEHIPGYARPSIYKRLYNNYNRNFQVFGICSICNYFRSVSISFHTTYTQKQQRNNWSITDQQSMIFT